MNGCTLLVLRSSSRPSSRLMAVRVLTYTGLLYEKLIDDGVLRHDGNSPPTFKAWLDRFSLNADILAEEGNLRAAWAVHRNPRQVSPRHQSARPSGTYPGRSSPLLTVAAARVVGYTAA